MRFSVTHLRVGILFLNVALTVLLAGQAALAIFYPPQSSPAPAASAAGSLKPGKEDGAGGKSPGLRVGQFAQRLFPPPAPPPPPTAPDGQKPEPAPGGTETEFPPGPLHDDWEFSLAIIYPGDPQLNMAVVAKKDPAAAAAAAAGKKAAAARPTRVVRSPVPGRARPQVPGQPAAPTDRKTLQNHRRWKDEDLKIDIMVEDINLREFVYSDANQPGKLFALVRKQEPYIDLEKPDSPTLKVIKEVEDPQNPEAKKDINIKEKAPDWQAVYDEWKKRKAGSSTSVSGSTMPRPPAPNAAHAANSEGARPKSTAEQLQELKKVTTEMEKSEKFKKIPKAEQDRLKALLGGKK